MNLIHQIRLDRETEFFHLQIVVDQKAFTLPEFAALFGRERTWAYRLKDAKKVKVIRDMGQLMVPASEVARLLSHANNEEVGAVIDESRSAPLKAASPEAPKSAVGTSLGWKDAVSRRKSNLANRSKGKKFESARSAALGRILKRKPEANG